jgi:hypothetical protein
LSQRQETEPLFENRTACLPPFKQFKKSHTTK